MEIRARGKFSSFDSQEGRLACRAFHSRSQDVGSRLVARPHPGCWNVGQGIRRPALGRRPLRTSRTIQIGFGPAACGRSMELKSLWKEEKHGIRALKADRSRRCGPDGSCSPGGLRRDGRPRRRLFRHGVATPVSNHRGTVATVDERAATSCRSGCLTTAAGMRS